MQRNGSREEAAATTQKVASARTSERRNFPGRVTAANRATGTEDGQVRGGEERVAGHCRSSGRPPPPPLPHLPPLPAGALPVVRGGARRSAARQLGRAALAARAGSAAHSGADYRDHRACADARCSCAADGGPAGERPEDPRHLVSCRAGYRCAQDQFPQQHFPANLTPCAAAGGTVGGSANSPCFR